MNNKNSVACITLVRDEYKINIRPIRFENSIRSQKKRFAAPYSETRFGLTAQIDHIVSNETK